MTSGTGWLKRAWAALRPRTAGRPYAVTCRCGKVLRGQRRATHQVPRCPGCGRAVFVAPLGAFHPPGDEPAGPRQYHSAWWLLVPALLCAILALAGLFGLVFLLRPVPATVAPPASPSNRERLLALIEQGRRELVGGASHLARKIFDQAIVLRNASPVALDEAEHYRLNQYQRQAALLAERMPVPLTTLLEQAERSPNDAAWRERFRAEYYGRGVVFDDTLRADPGRRVRSRQLDDLRSGQAVGRVALEDLALVQQLPLQLPQRWVIGARLKSMAREGGPGWVIRLDPESGVLFTEGTALEAEMPALRDDLEWRRLLLPRQQEMLQTLPAPRPYLPRE